MKAFKLGKRIINIPEKWEEVTFNQFIELSEYISDTQDNGIEVTDEEFYCKMWSIFAELPDKTLHDLATIDVIRFHSIVNFISETKIPQKDKVDVNILIDNKYKIKIKDFNAMSFGDYIDVQTFITKGTIKNYNRIISRIVEIYQPVKWLGIIIKYKKMQLTLGEKEMFINSLPAVEMQSISAFFLSFQKIYMKSMQASIRTMVRQMTRKVILQRIGVITFGCKMHVMKTLRKWISFLTPTSA